LTVLTVLAGIALIALVSLDGLAVLAVSTVPTILAVASVTACWSRRTNGSQGSGWSFAHEYPEFGQQRVDLAWAARFDQLRGNRLQMREFGCLLGGNVPQVAHLEQRPREGQDRHNDQRGS
jgi:hypothetical protein